METIGQKITSFRFIVFIITSSLTSGFVWACHENEKLIALQGIILGVVTLAGVLIGGKTATDVYGKK